MSNIFLNIFSFISMPVRFHILPQPRAYQADHPPQPGGISGRELPLPLQTGGMSVCEQVPADPQSQSAKKN